MDDDAQLIARLLAGDAEVIVTVRGWVVAAVSRYHSRLGIEAEDLEQEVLLDLMEALEGGRFRGQSRVATYVHSFARFKCIDRLRALGRHEMVEVADDDFTAADPSPFEELSRREDAAIAAQVVAALPAPCRELWQMIADGLSYREMSVRTGVAEGAIRVRVHRCRQRALEERERLLARRPRSL